MRCRYFVSRLRGKHCFYEENNFVYEAKCNITVKRCGACERISIPRLRDKSVNYFHGTQTYFKAVARTCMFRDTRVSSLNILHFSVSSKKLLKTFTSIFKFSFFLRFLLIKKERKKKKSNLSFKTKRKFKMGERIYLLKKKGKGEGKKGEEKEGREKESRLFYARIHGRPTMTVPENSLGRFVALNT